MEGKEIKLTQAAIAEYQQRLDFLKNVRRLEVAQQIKEARAFGDISENAEYDAAMDEQARIEYDITQLDAMLRNAVLIDEEAVDTNSVNVGVSVTLMDLSDNTTDVYDIVGSAEANPFINRISNESPVGHAIIGHVVDDIVEIQAPGGTMRFKIVNIAKGK